MFYHSTVVRYQAMTSDQKEQAVAAHVEALVSMGWRWEGRGLVPTIGPIKTDPDSARSGTLNEKLLTAFTKHN